MVILQGVRLWEGHALQRLEDLRAPDSGGTENSRTMQSHFRLASLASGLMKGDGGGREAAKKYPCWCMLERGGATHSRQREAWTGHHRVEKMVSSGCWMRATVGQLQNTCLALPSSRGQPGWLVQSPSQPARPSAGNVSSHYARLRGKREEVPEHSRGS